MASGGRVVSGTTALVEVMCGAERCGWDIGCRVSQGVFAVYRALDAGCRVKQGVLGI